jgi:hypothetical protein
MHALEKRVEHYPEHIYRKTATQIRYAVSRRIVERQGFVEEQKPILQQRLHRMGMDYAIEQVIDLITGDYFQQKLEAMKEEDQEVIAKILVLHVVEEEIVALTRITDHIVNLDIADDEARVFVLGEHELRRYFEEFDPNTVEAGDVLLVQREKYGMTEALGNARRRAGVRKKLF